MTFQEPDFHIVDNAPSPSLSPPQSGSAEYLPEPINTLVKALEKLSPKNMRLSSTPKNPRPKQFGILFGLLADIVYYAQDIRDFSRLEGIDLDDQTLAIESLVGEIEDYFRHWTSAEK